MVATSEHDQAPHTHYGTGRKTPLARLLHANGMGPRLLDVQHNVHQETMAKLHQYTTSPAAVIRMPAICYRQTNATGGHIPTSRNSTRNSHRPKSRSSGATTTQNAEHPDHVRTGMDRMTSHQQRVGLMQSDPPRLSNKLRQQKHRLYYAVGYAAKQPRGMAQGIGTRLSRKFQCTKVAKHVAGCSVERNHWGPDMS